MTLLLTLFAQAMADAHRQSRFGTEANLRRTATSVARFIDGRNVTADDVSRQFVEAYANHLEGRGVCPNTISFYMRNLRTVWRRACPCAIENPFGTVFTGVARTRKLAVDESDIRHLSTLRLTNAGQRLSRDLFIFSYAARGMSFVDVAYLRKSDISNGRITYIRHKTGRPMSIKMTDTLRRIVESYAGSTSPYVFPILTSSDSATAYAEYRRAINDHNRHLRQIAKRLPGHPRLTTYTARHTWATAARDHGVRLGVISAGLGHASERTTQIYLAEIADTTVDEANEMMTEGL